VTGNAWLLAVLGAGVGTYMLRAALFLWRPLYRIGRRYVDFLTNVSFAIAAGIVAKSLLIQEQAIRIDGEFWLRLLGVAAALLFFRFLRSTPAALFFGAGVAVGMKWLLGG